MADFLKNEDDKQKHVKYYIIVLQFQMFSGDKEAIWKEGGVSRTYKYTIILHWYYCTGCSINRLRHMRHASVAFHYTKLVWYCIHTDTGAAEAGGDSVGAWSRQTPQHLGREDEGQDGWEGGELYWTWYFTRNWHLLSSFSLMVYSKLYLINSSSSISSSILISIVVVRGSAREIIVLIVQLVVDRKK